MAADAIGRQACELPGREILVAGVAIGHSMCAKQWEAILVLLNRAHRYLPTIYGMATLALCSHLPAMDVSMTIGAAQPDIRKHRTHMALRAHNFFVHSAKWIFRPVVVELGNIANWLPACERVTVLTRDVERTVRTMSRDGILRLLRRCTDYCENNKDSWIQNLFRRQNVLAPTTDSTAHHGLFEGLQSNAHKLWRRISEENRATKLRNPLYHWAFRTPLPSAQPMFMRFPRQGKFFLLQETFSENDAIMKTE